MANARDFMSWSVERGMENHCFTRYLEGLFNSIH